MSSMLHCCHCHLEHVIYALSTCITKSSQNLVGDNSHTLQDAWQNPNAAAVYCLFRYTIMRKITHSVCKTLHNKLLCIS